ncbi:MAG: site-specific integrase [Acidithiobacillus ferrooxidans]|jgi:integrase|uniref:site-specific integrase n=1 Tax=Acidithiobacillus ferrooxidans TaxID=920 RepID=UPI000A9116E5|nr:site-specific integrase [Acidithiobacillus ferrooxidans]MDA8152259.1 site-specific integrase [Acidithiobacillus sp.]MDA8378508.1 site-specific integrase [Planctomycetia bacterium]MBU2858176.1 site-specific integrase [Acidithiobacillus ferrooxidans]MBU2860428.1 site-specific integrase [Acidithiobacillus ferrooxidans]MCR2829397.1 site-specific integrase [Acidithiobacillus ferrooxidans]
MATINSREDQDGITIGWQAIVRKKGYPSQTKTFRTKRDAEAWARLTESAMERGLWQNQSDADSTTLADALDRYGREVSSLKKSGKIELYRIGTLKTDKIAKLHLSRIRGADLAEYRDRRLNVGLSDSSVRLELAILSNLYTVAMKEWRMEGLRNPVLSVRKPSPGKARDRRLSPIEEKKLLGECTPPLKAIILFALETGMRRGEIQKLLWKDVDLIKCTAQLFDTKNGEDRTIPLSSRAIAVLKALPRNINGKVFPGADISHSFTAACRRAAIDDLRFHDLRHEATSRFFEKGLNPMQVAAITGHKTLQMLKRYTHLRAEDLAKMLG